MVSLESHSEYMAETRQKPRARLMIIAVPGEVRLKFSRACVLVKPWEPRHTLAIVLWVPWKAGCRIPGQPAPQHGRKLPPHTCAQSPTVVTRLVLQLDFHES